MSATRLPGKPLLKIDNLSIISHVVSKAKKAEIGRVVVCTEDKLILEDVINNGGEAILTGSYHSQEQIGYGKVTKNWPLKTLTIS